MECGLWISAAAMIRPMLTPPIQKIYSAVTPFYVAVMSVSDSSHCIRSASWSEKASTLNER